MAEEEQTLRQWARQEVNQQPLCITYPTATNLELKSGLLHLLPTFRGKENEDPHKFLTEFHVVCVGMKPHNVTEDQIKLRAFPFALQDFAKDWLYDLPPGTVNTWIDLAGLFLDKYFPEMKASALRREIIGIKQKTGETLHSYWERFKRLCSRCPKHGITERNLLQYFCEGMSQWERRLLNASSGGSIIDKTPSQIREIINNMAEDSRHTDHEDGFYNDAPRGVKEVSTSHLETQISELTKVVMLIAKDKGVATTIRPCGVCTQVGHPTDMCPQLQENIEEVQEVGNFQGQNHRQFNQPPQQRNWNQEQRNQGNWGQNSGSNFHNQNYGSNFQ